MSAFNDWHHVNGNTYGTWLPGDPRGWRERGHRKHCKGDYRSPPPKGSGDKLHQHARSLLTKPPVRLNAPQQVLAGRALVEMLVRQDIELLTLCLDDIHFHLLGRFPDAQVRPVVGRAKNTPGTLLLIAALKVNSGKMALKLRPSMIGGTK